MKKIINKHPDLEIEKFLENDKHHFFGYFGKSPWSCDNKYAVFLEVDFIDRFPKLNESAKIILINLKDKTSKVLTKTKAWNWQQGCMLQWIPHSKKNLLIFNDLRNKKLISRIVDIDSDTEEIIPFPIYDISSNGKYATSLSFEKLDNVRKGYGYNTPFNSRFNKKINSQEGLYVIDLENKTSKMIISLKDLYNYKPLNSMKSGRHWIDQPIFNPNGSRISFLHRWELENGLFYSRFFSINIDGSGLFMFPDSGYYSHFSWKSNSEILMFCSINESFKNIRKTNRFVNFLIKRILPIYRKIIPRNFRKKVIPTRYYLLKDKTHHSKKIDIHYEDGHPSFSPDKKYILTDTYPNSKHYRKLLLFNIENNLKINLSQFYTLPSKKFLETTKENEFNKWDNGPFRVDLHPRFNFQGDKICFDSVHEGHRNVYYINLKSLFKN